MTTAFSTAFFESLRRRPGEGDIFPTTDFDILCVLVEWTISRRGALRHTNRGCCTIKTTDPSQTGPPLPKEIPNKDPLPSPPLTPSLESATKYARPTKPPPPTTHRPPCCRPVRSTIVKRKILLLFVLLFSRSLIAQAAALVTTPYLLPMATTVVSGANAADMHGNWPVSATLPPTSVVIAVVIYTVPLNTVSSSRGRVKGLCFSRSGGQPHRWRFFSSDTSLTGVTSLCRVGDSGGRAGCICCLRHSQASSTGVVGDGTSHRSHRIDTIGASC